MFEKEKNPNSSRVVKTARNEKDINEDAIKGFRPLVKKVIPSDEIKGA